VLTARLSLELSECKVVPTLWGDSWVNQVVQGAAEDLGPKWLTGNCLRPSALCGVVRTLCAVRWRPPYLVEKLLSGGGIKVTKRAWRVPKWRAFVTSQVVFLGETWRPGSNTLVWVLQQRGLGVAQCLLIPCRVRVCFLSSLFTFLHYHLAILASLYFPRVVSC
jgi:hypothetical protein